MKKIISVLLIVFLIVGLFSGCGSDEDKALKTINSFIEAMEKSDTKKQIECLDPDLQTLIESGTNSIGNVLGIDNAYGMSAAFSSLIGGAVSDSIGMKIKFKQKEITSSKIGDDKATFYIVYTITVNYDDLDEPVSTDAALEFKLNKKDGKWYILTYEAVDEGVDTEILAEGRSIYNATDFSNGVAFIQYEDESGNYKTVAIDTKGETLYECDDISYTQYINEIMVVENLIYNKKGEIIASPEKSGYDSLISDNINGLVMAIRKEESFNGDVYKIGVLNNKGEWEHPLSEENPIVLKFKEKETQLSEHIVQGPPEDSINKNVVRISVGYFDNLYYDVVKNECNDGYLCYKSEYYQGQTNGIYKYTLSGDKKLIIPNVQGDLMYDEIFLGRPTTEYDGYYEADESKQYLYDYSGNIVMDLSQYKNINTTLDFESPDINYVNEHLLTTLENGTGGLYLALIKKDGTTAFEPIKMGSQDNCYRLDENGFVLESFLEDGSQTFTAYSYNGNTTVYEDITYFGGFNDGLALVKNSGEQYYYIDFAGNKIIK